MTKENRTHLLDENVSKEKRWALFARRPKGRGAHFCCLLDSREKASAVANQYAYESLLGGSKDFTFYVVELHEKIGIEHGKEVFESLT